MSELGSVEVAPQVPGPSHDVAGEMVFGFAAGKVDFQRTVVAPAYEETKHMVDKGRVPYVWLPGLDHFGEQIDEVRPTFERMQRAGWLKPELLFVPEDLSADQWNDWFMLTHPPSENDVTEINSLRLGDLVALETSLSQTAAELAGNKDASDEDYRQALIDSGIVPRADTDPKDDMTGWMFETIAKIEDRLGIHPKNFTKELLGSILDSGDFSRRLFLGYLEDLPSAIDLERTNIRRAIFGIFPWDMVNFRHDEGIDKAAIDQVIVAKDGEEVNRRGWTVAAISGLSRARFQTRHHGEGHPYSSRPWQKEGKYETLIRGMLCGMLEIDPELPIEEIVTQVSPTLAAYNTLQQRRTHSGEGMVDRSRRQHTLLRESIPSKDIPGVWDYRFYGSAGSRRPFKPNPSIRIRRDYTFRHFPRDLVGIRPTKIASSSTEI